MRMSAAVPQRPHKWCLREAVGVVVPDAFRSDSGFLFFGGADVMPECIQSPVPRRRKTKNQLRMDGRPFKQANPYGVFHAPGNFA
jgi:hypothetical protein